MAKLKMKYVRIYAHRQDRKPLLEALQRLGVLDVEKADVPSEGFACPDTSAAASGFDRNAQTALQALAVLDQYCPAKKGMLASMSGRREISEQQFLQAPTLSVEAISKSLQILELEKKVAEYAAEAVCLTAAMEGLGAWAGLDLPMSFAGTRTTGAVLGTFPRPYTLEELTVAVAQKAPELDVELEIISSRPEQTCFIALMPKAQQSMAEQAFRELGFARPAQQTSKKPTDKIAQYKARLQDMRQKRQQAVEQLQNAGTYREQIELAHDYYTVRADKYRVIGGLEHSKNTFIIGGYIPEEDLEQFQNTLTQQFALVIEVEDAPEEKAPVKLKNNAFFRPAETITQMYAMPTATDIDPTPLTGLFYYLFFGMMLSDAGYGLLLTLGAWWMIKKFNPERAMRRNLTMFMYCGVSTILWGLVFGSFFGDAIPLLTEAFFGKAIRLPALLDPMNGDAVVLLVLSLALGLVQILAGLCAKFWMQWKSGDRLGACFDSGFWITVLLGLAMVAGGMVLGGALTTIGASVAVASAVGLVLTQGRHKKGVMKLISGLASLYDATGFISDLLSFSRLMALGLTTAAMASVFNMLSTMAGGGIGGAIVLLIIFPITHAINFGLNALGAYVHTLRLQYVELFGKFYEGGGREFKPFALYSKFTRIKEEK